MTKVSTPNSLSQRQGSTPQNDRLWTGNAAGGFTVRLAWRLKDLPVELLGRLRSDRVLAFPPPPRRPGRGGPSRHGPEFKLADPATWPVPAVSTAAGTTRYGTAAAQAGDRLHPRLTSRAAWEHHDGGLPVIDGTLIRLRVDHLPGGRDPRPVAVVIADRRYTGRARPPVAGVLAPF